MKKPTVQRIWLLLCAVFILNACQKELSSENPVKENSAIHATGAIPDDPALLAKVPLIISSEFYNGPKTLGGRVRFPKNKDADGDGIPDATDLCPTQKETVNGYQDEDGCPDTPPSPTATDTDGDGIIDSQDVCPTEPETFNGYEDTDGCPDVLPVVLPPTSLPASYQLNMPPVGHQGSEGSCVAWATSYARACEEFYRTKAASYSQSTNVFSPEFIYNQTKIAEDCGSGTAFTLTLNLLVNKGVCSWQTMPYDIYNGCSLLPTPLQDTEASNYRIAIYSKVVETDRQAIKNMISNNHPVMIDVTIDGNFKSAFPGFIWNSYSGYSGNHSVVICGYDDAKNAYKVINSWGTAWGDAGYTWIDYDFFPTVSSNYVYVIN